MDSHHELFEKKLIKKKSFILSLFGVLFLALPLMIFLLQQQQQSQQSAAETITLKAINDSYVSSNFPDTPVGSNELLQVKGGGVVSLTYLKFDLASLAGKTVTDAKLHLYTSEGSVSTQSIKNVSNNWQESQITYNNRPWPGTVITTFNNTTTNAWKIINLTSTVDTNKGEILSLVIDSTETDELSIKSKESPDGNSPMLVITTTSTGDTATTASTVTGTTPTPIFPPCPPDTGPSGWPECHFGEPQYNLQACRTHAEQYKGVSGPTNGTDTEWFNWAQVAPKPLSCGTACGVAPSYCLPPDPDPDLIVTDMKITYDNTSGTYNCPAGLGLLVTIKNQGQADAIGSITVKGNNTNKSISGGLVKGASKSVWIPDYVQAGSNTAIVDPGNLIKEVSDANNSLTQVLPVPTMPIECIPPKPTVNLTTDKTSIFVGDDIKLTWTSTGADTCTATTSPTSGVSGWTGNKTVSGNQDVGPFTAAGAYTLTLTCSNSSGSTSDNVVISVLNEPTQVPAPTVNLTASETEITTGDSTVLTWTSTDAENCTASGQFNGWSGTKSTSGNGSVGPFNQVGNYTLTLTCTNSAGSGSDSVVIKVVAPTPTLTPVPSDLVFNLDVYLHGVGNSGDNRNPSSELSNKNPLHPTRLAVVELYDNSNQLIASKEANINYTQSTGNFLGTVNMGNTITTGNYTIKIKTEQHLRNQYSGILELNPGMTVDLAPISLVTGDVDDNNRLDILDYNVLYGCYTSDLMPTPRNCSVDNTVNSDINDDGGTNLFDLNLFIRELSVQSGL